MEEINHMIAIILEAIDPDQGIGTIIRIDILTRGITEIIEINQGITEISEINQGTDLTTIMIERHMKETSHRRTAIVEI